MKRRSASETEAIVLSALHETTPVSAYGIARLVGARGTALAPSQVYRTLQRLLTKNRAYRVETCDAYVARSGPADMCLVCSSCRHVTLLRAPQITETLVKVAATLKFDASRPVVEAVGLCRACRLNAYQVQAEIECSRPS